MELTENGVLVSHANLEMLRQRLEESEELTEQLETLKRERAEEAQAVAAQIESIKQVHALEMKRAVRAAIAGTCAEADSVRECHDAELARAREDARAAQRVQLESLIAHRENVESLEAQIDELKSRLSATVRICETEKRRADALKSSRDQIDAELHRLQERKQTTARRETAMNTESGEFESDHCNQSLISDANSARVAAECTAEQLAIELSEAKGNLAAVIARNLTQNECDRIHESSRKITTNVDELETTAFASPARTTMAPTPVSTSVRQNALKVPNEIPPDPIPIVIVIKIEHAHQNVSLHAQTKTSAPADIDYNYEDAHAHVDQNGIKDDAFFLHAYAKLPVDNEESEQNNIELELEAPVLHAYVRLYGYYMYIYT